MGKEYYLGNTEKEIQEWLDNEIEDYRERIATQEKSVAEAKSEEKRGKENHLKWLKKSLKKLEKIKTLKTVKGRLKSIQKFNGGGLDENGLYWLGNPSAKWDWWLVGGRWNNWLITKKGEETNSCKVKDLDLEAMRKKAVEEAEKYYDEEMTRSKENNSKPFFWNYKETPTREQYVQDADKPVCPYAVLYEGEWMGKGEMGWWGIDDPNYTEEEWGKQFSEFLKKLDPEEILTVVDCHI